MMEDSDSDDDDKLEPLRPTLLDDSDSEDEDSSNPGANNIKLDSNSDADNIELLLDDGEFSLDSARPNTPMSRSTISMKTPSDTCPTNIQVGHASNYSTNSLVGPVIRGQRNPKILTSLTSLCVFSIQPRRDSRNSRRTRY